MSRGNRIGRPRLDIHGHARVLPIIKNREGRMHATHRTELGLALESLGLTQGPGNNLTTKISPGEPVTRSNTG